MVSLWGSKNDDVDGNKNTEQITNYARGQKILLQDTKPKFDIDSNTQVDNGEMVKKAFSTISKDDFSMEKLTSMPCFRDAGLVGFASMLILGSMTFVYNKNITRSTNWAMGGLVFGSIFGWEQCRLKRQKSFEIAQLAMQTVRAKERPMMNKKNDTGNVQNLKNEWDSHPNDATDSNKKWYKFW